MGKILIANWTWYPSGGDWTYVENLCRFYESRGHEVVPFSMHDDRNFATPYSKYFVSKIDYKELNKKKSPLNAVKAVKNTIYSVEAKRKIRQLLDEHSIDMVHLNNIHHYLSPASIIPEIKKKKIPIIWTLHDYSVLCPNTTFISNDKVCENCKGGRYYRCVIQKCKKGSTLASMVAAMESYTNKWLNPYKHVDYYLCPSKFLADKFIDFGFEREKIVNLYNLFDISAVDQVPPASPTQKYVLYVGNILKVKGIFTLAAAMKGIDTDLCIIGDGEAMPELKSFVEKEGLTNVKFLGKKPKTEVLSFVRNSQFVVVPSEWYENLPYSLVEALLLSKPVLGAKIGGIPELVLPNETGLLFESGNLADLRARLQEMLAMPESELVRMGENASRHARQMVNYKSFEAALSVVFDKTGVPLVQTHGVTG